MGLLTNVFYLISTSLLIPVMLVLLWCLARVLVLVGALMQEKLRRARIREGLARFAAALEEGRLPAEPMAGPGLLPERLARLRGAPGDEVLAGKLVGEAELATAPLGNYNLVFIWGMGLHLDEEQLAALERAREQNTQIAVLTATNDLSRKQNTLGEEQQEVAAEYLKHGGEENIVALLHYVAHEFAGRDVEVPPVVEKPQFGFFHLGDAMFPTQEEYEAYLARKRPGFGDDAPRVALFGPFLDPRDRLNRSHVDYLIEAFERRGARVYPIFGRREAIGLLEQVEPDLAIAFPHGRLIQGNEGPEVLAGLDIPCLTALSLAGSRADWMADERGMAGGFLGQSVVMPELDGAIEPMPVCSLEPNERSIRVRTKIDDRIDKLVARAANWLALRRKPNAQNRKGTTWAASSPKLRTPCSSGFRRKERRWANGRWDRSKRSSTKPSPSWCRPNSTPGGSGKRCRNAAGTTSSSAGARFPATAWSPNGTANRTW